MGFLDYIMKTNLVLSSIISAMASILAFVIFMRIDANFATVAMVLVVVSAITFILSIMYISMSLFKTPKPQEQQTTTQSSDIVNLLLKNNESLNSIIEWINSLQKNE